MPQIYTSEELRACAEREIKQRKKVYGWKVQNGKMTEAFARDQIGKMEAIEAHFAELAEEEKLL